MDKLLDLLAKHGIRAPVEWNTEKPTRDGAQWFIGKSWIWKDKEYYQAWYGDYKTGLQEKWQSHETYTKEEKKEADQQLKATLKAEKEAREIAQKEIAHEQCDLWELDSDTGRTPYMDRKGISNLYGARVRANPSGDPILIVPLYDIFGKIWNLQRIYSQKLSKGDKFFADGARIEGLFHTLTSDDVDPVQALSVAEKILICEGYATACSVKEAHPESTTAVVAAFNAGNLQAVCQAIKTLVPQAQLVVCADNDAYTVIDGKPVNVGLIKARHAAGAVGASVCYPVFKYPQKGLTDFNDLKAAQGLDAVRDQILNPGKYRTEIEPMILPTGPGGKARKPKEIEIVEYILSYYKGGLLKYDTNLFKYTGTHWKEFEEKDYDYLKLQICLAGNNLPSKDVAATYKSFMFMVPHVPSHVNLHQSNPWCANFMNGTLYAEPGGGLKWSPTHNKSDYLTHVLPFDCPNINSEPTPAPMFDNWLARMWQGDEDREAKVRLYHQLMGACLCPAYPNITFFIGPPNSGKSTLVKMLVKMVNIENTSQVQLSDMEGFGMAGMINKLVNFDTELELNRPIKDVFVKKIIDRMPFTVKRKFKADATAFLPAIHLFAANDVPASLDGQSQAYGRRIIIVKTEKLALQIGEERYDFEHELWTAESQGIIGRALEGLRDLHKHKGKFIRPESSAYHVNEMQIGNDIVGQYLEAAKHNELGEEFNTISFGENARVKPLELWSQFNGWQSVRVANSDRIGQYMFYRRMKLRGFEIRGVKGERTFRGIGSMVPGEAIG